MEALAIVQPGLATKEIIEQSTSFAFVDGCVVTYNDEISIRHPVPNLELEGAIKASEFYKLLEKLNKDEIDMDVDGAEVRLKCGRTKATFTLKEKVVLPISEVGEIKQWQVVPEKFVEAISFCIFSCSKQMTTPVLTCVHVDTENNWAESSDNYRLTKHTFPSGLDIPKFLLPYESAMVLSTYGPAITHVSEGEGWIHFRMGTGTIFSARVFDDKYPDTSMFYEVSGQDLQLPKTLGDILERAEIFSKRAHVLDEYVTIDMANNQIGVQATSEVGSFHESANTKYGDNPISFSINPGFLKLIVEQVRSCKLDVDKLKFSAEDWEHVIALNQDVTQ